MKKSLFYFLLLFAVLGAAAGCKKDDTAVKNAIPKLMQDIISGVNGPTKGLVNDELKFNILWDNSDSTLRFHHLQDSVYHNTHIIRLFVATVKSNDTTQVVKQPNNLVYKFKPTVAGTYYLKFYKPENTDQSAIIDTVVITK